MRKPLFLLLSVASIGFAQPFRFGVEGGLPLTGAFDTNSSAIPAVLPAGPLSYSSSTQRYAFGGTAELDLPFHLAVKADALYKRLSFDSAGLAPITATTTTANSWEFPVLAKYGVSKLGPLQPYVEGGVAFRALQGVNQTSVTACLGCAPPDSIDQSPCRTGPQLHQGLRRRRRPGIPPPADWRLRRDPLHALDRGRVLRSERPANIDAEPG